MVQDSSNRRGGTTLDGNAGAVGRLSLWVSGLMVLTLTLSSGATWAGEPTTASVASAAATESLGVADEPETEPSVTESAEQPGAVEAFETQPVVGEQPDVSPDSAESASNETLEGGEDPVIGEEPIADAASNDEPGPTPRAIANCAPGFVYVIGSGQRNANPRPGQVLQIDPAGNVTNFGPQLTDPQMYSGIAGNSSDPSWNGLAMTANGTKMYVIARTKPQQARIWAYDGATNSWGSEPIFDQNVAGQGSDSDLPNGFRGFLLAGAVEPISGNFVYGGYDNGSSGNTRFMLWSYNPSTGTNTYVGYVPVDGNNAGDIVFDAQGNLYVLSGNDTTTSTFIYSVTKAHYDAAAGGAMISSKSEERTFVQNANGVALDANGYIYATASTTVFKGELPDMPSTVAVNSDLFAGFENKNNWSSNDAASCSFPPIIRLEKNVVGRNVDTDQFGLSLSRAPSTLLGSNTTEGTRSGVQDQMVGPFPTARRVTFNFAESAAGTTDLGDYATSYVCTPEGSSTVLTSGTTTSGSLTYPAANTGINSVVCTFTNTPLLIPVIVDKTVQDVNGENPEPGQGWALGMSATGAASQNPEATTQITSDNGIVNWTVRLPDPGATVGITVSEEQEDGYSLVTTPDTASQCVVTHADGSSTTTPLTDITGNIAGVKAGDRVACGFTNRLKPAYLTLVKVLQNPEVGTGYATPDDWTLTASGQAGEASVSAVSGVSGTDDVTRVEVMPGLYNQLTETSDLSAGYDWTDLSCVDADGDSIGFDADQSGGVVTGGSFSVRAGNDITCTYTNTPKPGSVTWEKTGGNGKPLAGSQWTLTGPGVAADTVVTDCTQAPCPTGPYTDQDPRPGSFELAGLVWGGYSLTESTAPAGYVRDTTVHGFTISHENRDHTFEKPFENVPREVPPLPLTGGQSAALFTLLGSSLLAGALAMVATRRRNPFGQDA